MTRYIQTLGELVEYLDSLDDYEILKWMSDFIMNNHASPLTFLFKYQSPKFLLLEAFEIDENYLSKRRIKNAIIEIYTSYPSNKYNDSIFTDLLEIIGCLEIDDLFPLLWRQAIDQQFKNILIVGFPKSIDLHTYLLKSLFGLAPKSKDDILDLITIIERDIINPKYSIECFEAYSLIPNHIFSPLKYLTMIIDQIDEQERDTLGTIRDYLDRLGYKLFCDNLDVFLKELSSKEYLEKLNRILFELKIEIFLILNKSINKSVWCIKWFGEKEREIQFDSKFSNQLKTFLNLNNRDKMIDYLDNPTTKIINICDKYDPEINIQDPQFSNSIGV